MDHKVGIVGCGRMAGIHAEAYAQVPRARVVAAADLSPTRLDAFRARYGIGAGYADYRELLEKERPDIVSVCTTDDQHCPVTVAAAEAGVRGVLCEKPMAFNLGDADRMLAACAASGTKLVVDHSERWELNFAGVKDMLARGDVGELRSMVGTNLGGLPPPDSWHAQYAFAGGGALMHNGTHLFDLFRFYAGDAAWLFAHVQRHSPDRTIEDTSTGLVYLKNDTHLLFEIGGRRRYSTWEVLLEGDEGRIAIVHGSRNRLETARGNGWQPYIYRWRHGWEPFRWEEVPTVPDDPAVTAINELIACIENGGESISSGREGRAALELLMAVYESQRRGGAKVTLPLEVSESPLLAMLEAGDI